jgi:2-octaprenyl-6-methoxyphenol hydroxylase
MMLRSSGTRAHFGTRTGGFCAWPGGANFRSSSISRANRAALRCAGNGADAASCCRQGFNVGLRDAWELAEVALDTPRERLGDRAMLERYLRGRRTDRIAGIAFTHGLVNVFGNDLPLVRWPRGLALTMLDAVPAAKRAFTRAMLFGLR